MFLHAKSIKFTLQKLSFYQSIEKKYLRIAYLLIDIFNWGYLM